MARVQSAVWLCAGSILLSVALGEFMARWLLPPPFRAVAHENQEPFRKLHQPDPVLGWKLADGPLQFHHRLVDSRGAVQYDVVYSVENAARKTSFDPPQGPAVITAGCSFTFGHGLNDRDTWPWLLQEKLLQEKVSHDRVINLGCMGYGTDQALLAVERQIQNSRGKVDAVVLGFADFQVDRNRATQGWLGVIYPFAKPLFAMGPTGPEFRREVHFWGPRFLVDRSALGAHIANILGNRFYGISSHNQARTLTLELMKAFASRFQAHGVQLIVAMLPYADDQSPVAQSDTAFIIDGLREAKIPVLVPEFPRGPDHHLNVAEFLVSPIDRHPNRAYNLIVAGQVARFLEGRPETVGARAQCCR